MRTNSNLPPPHLLEALQSACIPPRPKPGKPVRGNLEALVLLERWKRRGRPITVAEVNDLADILIDTARPVEIEHATQILLAIDAAGISLRLPPIRTPRIPPQPPLPIDA